MEERAAIGPGDPESRVQPREYWLDLARVIAIVSITFNHALSRSFATLEGSLEEFLQMSAAGSLLKALLYAFSRIGVPLFLMITGALLLKRDYEDRAVTRRFLRHNWWELCRTVLIWEFIMFWFLQFDKDEALRTVGIGRALREMAGTMLFVNQTTLPHRWYMPMILVVYLMIPVISVGLKRLGNRFFGILFALAAVSGLLVPTVNSVLFVAGSTFRINFALNITNLFSLYFVYILAGYWISEKKPAGVRTLWIGLGFAGSLLVTALFPFWAYSTPRNFSLTYTDLGILISAALLFELVRRKAAAFRAIRKPVTYLSRISLGIFFLHLCIMTGLVFALSRIWPVSGYPKFLILEASSFLLSVLIIRVTSRSKKIRHYLYLIKE